MKNFISISAVLSFAVLGAYGQTANNLRGRTDSHRDLASFSLDQCKQMNAPYELHGGMVNGKRMVFGTPQESFSQNCPVIKINGAASPVLMDASDEYSISFYSDDFPWTITEPFSSLFTLTDIELAMRRANTARLSTTKKLFQNFGYYTYRFVGSLYEMKQPDEAFSNNYKNDGHAFFEMVMFDEGEDYLNSLRTDPFTLSVLAYPPEPDSTYYSVACEVARQFASWMFNDPGYYRECYN